MYYVYKIHQKLKLYTSVKFIIRSRKQIFFFYYLQKSHKQPSTDNIEYIIHKTVTQEFHIVQPH